MLATLITVDLPSI